MKSKLHKLFYPALVAIVLLICINTSAQVGQNNFSHNMPKPLGTTWLDVSFYDNNNGIAVGNASTIARTTDGGATWSYGVVMFNTASGFKQRPTLQDVHYVTPTVAYATGDSGMVLKSTDAGRNWTQINNPLYATSRNVNAVWFLNKDTGYIAGQPQRLNPVAADSSNPDFAPKLYFTRNGGNTWDSINAPRGAESMVGFIANPSNSGVRIRINPVGKEIFRIVFSSRNVGYIVGSAGGGNFSQPYPGGASTFAANISCLLWKFDNGIITDYSLTKEKLGYTGIMPFGGTPTTTSTYNSTSLPSQSIKAVAPLNDSVVVITSFNNGASVRIQTGVNDSTALAFNPTYTPNLSGVFAKGKYTILQYSNQPTQTVPPPPVIPAQVLPTSNMVNMVKAPSGNLYVSSGQGRVGVYNATSGSWAVTQALPATFNFTGLQLFAVDATANGKIHVMGNNGVYTTSTDGVNWTPNYSAVTLNAGLNKMEFADCNNGIVMGNAGLLLSTTDGGKTWTDKTIGSFGPTVSTLGISYPDPNRFYFTATNGNIYFSSNQGTSNNLLFVPSRPSTNYGMATFGTGNTTRIWVTSYRSTAALNERVVIYRSLNNGATWDTIKQFSAMTPTTANINISQVIKFVDANTGYLAGARGFVYKTTDGGTTWTNISPDPALTSITGFAGQHAIGVSPSGNTLIYWALVSTTRYMYKSTNGGATWTTNIMPITIANEPVTNIGDFLMHDDNNFVALTGPNKILITNDGANTWRFDQAPSGAGFTAAQFLPKTVPAGTPMANRKIILSGNQILEYGSSSSNVTSTENVITSCATANNGSITINATGGIAPYTYSINGGAFQTGNTFNNLGVGTYTIAIKDNGCGPDFTKTITVGLRPAPSIFAGNDRTIVDGDEIVLDGTGTATAASIVWSPNNSIITGATTYTPTVKPRTTTNYLLTVTDANGCISTDNSIITVIPYCLKVQNAFSPNADGINDRWQVTNGAPCFNKIMAAVYNRYGNLVYKNDNYQNNWDGTYEGKPLPDGTYYYVVTYNLINGRGQVLKGDVTILR